MQSRLMSLIEALDVAATWYCSNRHNPRSGGGSASRVGWETAGSSWELKHRHSDDYASCAWQLP